MLLNGTRKAKFRDLACGPHVHRVHVIEQNYCEDCSDNTAVSRVNGLLSS
jgi:hypothetical protein